MNTGAARVAVILWAYLIAFIIAAVAFLLAWGIFLLVEDTQHRHDSHDMACVIRWGNARTALDSIHVASDCGHTGLPRGLKK